MSDEELDLLFQRGAEAYPADSFVAGWERLEDKLNTAAKARLLRRKIGQLALLELLVLSLVLWPTYHFIRSAEVPAARITNLPYSPSAAASLKTNRPPKAALLTNGKPAPAAPGPAASGLIKSKSSPLTKAETTPATLAATASPAPPTGFWRAERPLPAHPAQPVTALISSAPNPRRPAQSTAPAAAEPALVAFTRGQKPLPRTRVKPAEARAARQPAAPRGLRAAAAVAPSATAPDLLVPILMSHVLDKQIVDMPDTLAQRALISPPADSVATVRRSPAPSTYRLLLGVLGAPTASAVRTARSARLGGDFGLTLEYRLTSRLRVRAGLISSAKRYEAPSSDYQVPTAWQWFAADYQVRGSCRITEIPLDLRFDVLIRPSSILFTSLGVNSLLMRDERYSYDWTLNGQTFTKAAEVVKGSRHFLQVLNFSAGLERPLGGRWSAQAEPFFQLPLGGVGAGQVRLSSAGLAFSLKYGLR